MIRRLFLSAIVVAAVAFFAYGRHGTPNSPSTRTDVGVGHDTVVAGTFDKGSSSAHVEGRGTIMKILPDDNDGSRHQRFIVRLQSGQTILIAHNIDIAARVPALKSGDEVAFSGEYIWNAKGGVVHWTHRNPDGGHPSGWIKYNGQLFQ